MSWQNLNLVGETLFTGLPKTVSPTTARSIFKLMEADLLRGKLGGDAALADALMSELRGEFQSGAIDIILRGAERAARRAEKAQRPPRTVPMWKAQTATLGKPDVGK